MEQEVGLPWLFKKLGLPPFKFLVLSCLRGYDVKIPILASQVYGSATDEIRDALTFVSSISWFRTPKLVSQQELDNLVQKHLTSVEAFAKVDLSQVNRVDQLVGGLELLHENRWAVDPYGSPQKNCHS